MRNERYNSMVHITRVPIILGETGHAVLRPVPTREQLTPYSVQLLRTAHALFASDSQHYLRGNSSRLTASSSQGGTVHALLRPAFENSSRPLCVQFPTLPQEGTAHAIFVSSSHRSRSGHLPSAFLALKNIFHFSFQLLTKFQSFCLFNKEPITLLMVYGSFVFNLKTSYNRSNC